MESLRTLAVPVDQLNPLPGNPRRGDADAIARSLERFGQRKPVVARRDGTVIAGNHTLEAARRLGWSEIAVVYVDDDDATAKAFALADNRTAELGSYDEEALATMIAEVRDADELLLLATGWVDDDLELLADNTDAHGAGVDDPQNRYTAAINVPQYEIVGEQPTIGDLFDATKADQLAAEIRAADIPDDIRRFLLEASRRHVVFNYRKIAEYYPHATPAIQQLMERSALVIIDFDDAMANGYMRFAAAMTQLEADERTTNYA